jgi:hypothetical protein
MDLDMRFYHDLRDFALLQTAKFPAHLVSQCGEIYDHRAVKWSQHLDDGLKALMPQQDPFAGIAD